MPENDRQPKALTEPDFAELLDRHGADPARWPAAARASADALLARSEGARKALAGAERLEQSLARVLPGLPPPLGLATRIVANAPPRDAWLDWCTVRLWRPVALACLPLACGFVVGSGFVEDPGELDDVALVAFADSGQFSVFDEPLEAGEEP